MAPPLISVCIPSYNRSQFLQPLLNSILSQNFQDFEVVICEDLSPQRHEIINIVEENYDDDPRIKLYLNDRNLGYDANFRELLEKSTGEYCFFMGNDDLMAQDALEKVSQVLETHSNIGLILRSYDWFVTDPDRPEQVIRYFGEDRIFPAGVKTIATAYRRCGVLSGYVIHRQTALNYATAEFDGFLFYQMYLAASVLSEKRAYYIRSVITHSRSTEAPDFGNSVSENKVFTPGKYTPEARLHMVTGMLTIAHSVQEKTGLKFADDVERDIANYVYPYISDQLTLPPRKFLDFYKKMSALGLGKYKAFHLHFLVAYLLKEKGYNKMTTFIRQRLGRSPTIGNVYAGERPIELE